MKITRDNQNYKLFQTIIPQYALGRVLALSTVELSKLLSILCYSHVILSALACYMRTLYSTRRKRWRVSETRWIKQHL